MDSTAKPQPLLTIDRSIIPQINETPDELPTTLQQLGVLAYDAQEVEKGIKEQVDEAIKKNKLERQSPFAKEIENTKQDIKHLEAAISSAKVENETEIASLKGQKKGLQEAQKKHQAYIALLMKKATRKATQTKESSAKVVVDPFDAALDAAEHETEQARLIRLGKITPFQNVEGLRKRRRDEETENNNNNNNSSNNDQTVMDTETNEKPSKEAQQTPIRVSRSNKKRKKLEYRLENTWVDDGDDDAYEERLKQWTSNQQESDGEPDQAEANGASDDDIAFEGGFSIPGEIYDGLFEYQKTGVQWMWELHCQSAGGIIGDEMGLGKTIQIIAFLASLHHSKMLEAPSLIVVPATVMQQWVHEFHKWWPPFRVMLLHESSSHKGKRKDIVKQIQKDGHNGILITTYDSVRINQKLLLKYNWDYIILDEGHKIRNPDAEITLAVKQFPTPHRLVLSGAPIQVQRTFSFAYIKNNLTELWSIFDFVFPGKLGTLPTFQTEFAIPITVGGYANASSIQVQAAYRCAVALRDLINPYLLRRMKSHVLDSLPKKTEHVLFCQLTEQQRKCYVDFLKSEDVTGILDGKRNLLFGIDILRKICNHPDLLLRVSEDRPEDYGFWNRSGKLKVLDQLLPMWKEQGHRVLVFAQTRQMLDIMETFVQLKHFNYLRLDGATAVKSRMELVDNFNKNDNIFLFLLSTRVGGLGLNLIGANRVLIFDPDWNPSTDIQARERAWRIGQKKDVTIYRLMTSGTIEEKIYHRQIFKQFLTDRILKDPEQQRFFKFKHLKDLFTLGSDEKPNDTEEIVDMNFGHEKSEILMKDAEDAEPSNNNDDTEEKKDETFILKKLFDGEDVLNVIRHDKLMGHSSHDIKKLESEADKIAQKALQALKRSREMCLQKDISIPTWTGKSGLSGAPTSLIKRFGNVARGNTGQSSPTVGPKNAAPGFTTSNAPVRSAELIDHIQNNRTSSNNSSFFGEANRTKMMGELVDFLQTKPDKKAFTEEIVSHFKLRITKEESYIFRSMLKVVASFHRDSKCWKLREDV